MNRLSPAHTYLFLFILLVSAFQANSVAAAAESERIVVLPFRCSGIDESLTLRAEERTREIISEDESFQIIKINGSGEEFSESQSCFLESSELRTIMKNLGASIIVEGSLEQTENDKTNIEIRISARSSTWRPPTVLSATASAPEYTVPRTEALVRQFIDSYSEEQSMERFFQSALIPGLGQYREGHKSKAGFFFFGTTGCLFGSLLLPGGDSYTGHGTVEMRQYPGNVTRWYIGDTVVTPEEAAAEMKRRADAENSREKAQRRKRFLIGAGLALYAVNLYDILKITKRYDTTRGDYFSFKLNPFSPKKMVCLDCNFNL